MSIVHHAPIPSPPRGIHAYQDETSGDLRLGIVPADSKLSQVLRSCVPPASLTGEKSGRAWFVGREAAHVALDALRRHGAAVVVLARSSPGAEAFVEWHRRWILNRGVVILEDVAAAQRDDDRPAPPRPERSPRPVAPVRVPLGPKRGTDGR